ncbi:putative molybdenum carrier protein [Bauldia litoralis]|uniref:Putative molybdenum carrier n=1 Tax=Bauldia litoralis TaxID=665467 RepID=A0A1G6B6C0_9HYPH|nr:putative molybdenum carrier protein [Bauldia litoralis]SDB16132.1 Putative molybdenum carrier [Bauldia litoralis]
MIVVSGGQTGVDRAALKAAVALGLAHGGWVPRDGWAEDQPQPPGICADYPELKPTPSADPVERTEWNVRDSDRTLILVSPGGLAASPGTAATLRFARCLGRPALVVPVDAVDAAGRIAAWLPGATSALVLNVAGPRESEAPGIQAAAEAILRHALTRYAMTAR